MSKKRRNKSYQQQNIKSSALLEKPRRRKKIHRQRDRFMAALGAILAIFIGYKWWSHTTTEKQIQTLAAEDRNALDTVQSFPSEGRMHLEPGQPYSYQHRFPTSGHHDPQWVEPGVYTKPQPLTKLVHAAEHGNIVIYYDEPQPEVLDRLEAWADHYDGKWSGIVLTPRPNLGDEIVLTAWTKMLRLDPFDPAAAAAFIDTYRGRGPERPIR